MAQIARLWYNFAMTSYDMLYDEAIGSYGLVTVQQAKALGITNTTLVKLAQRGKLERLGYGLYRLDKYVPSAEGLDAYACAVARVGKAAYLWGPSVLAIHHLCPTTPSRLYVATPNRYRGKLPEGISVRNGVPCEHVENSEGIPVQPVPDAILSSQHIIMLDRLLSATHEAEAKGIFGPTERERIIRELYRND